MVTGKIEVKIERTAKIHLPMPLVCKKDGFTDATMNYPADQFCSRGLVYTLVGLDYNESPDHYVVETDNEGTEYQTDHYMTYEFMAEYFYVPF